MLSFLKLNSGIIYLYIYCKAKLYFMKIQCPSYSLEENEMYYRYYKSIFQSIMFEQHAAQVIVRCLHWTKLDGIREQNCKLCWKIRGAAESRKKACPTNVAGVNNGRLEQSLDDERGEWSYYKGIMSRQIIDCWSEKMRK